MSRARYYPAVTLQERTGVFLPAECDPIPAMREAALLANAALNLLYPPRCPFCGKPSGGAVLCPSCRQDSLRYERKRRRLYPGLHCIGKLAGAAAVYPYHSPAGDAIRAAKYSGAVWNGPPLGLLMAQKLFGCTILRRCGILYPARMSAAALDYDLIVPVPPSQQGRGSNLPTLLAQQLCEGLGLPLVTGLLQRRQGSRPQAGLGYADRLVNAAGGFYAVPGAAEWLEGKRVLLVDDVITTGATVAACTHALLAAGAESVFAVSLCVSERKAGRCGSILRPKQNQTAAGSACSTRRL